MTLNPYNDLAIIYDNWILGDNTHLDVVNFYKKIINNYKINSFIELGIGTGRISIEIVKSSNIKAIGIDNSQNMLKICKKNILKNNIPNYKIKLIKQNILKFHKKSNFIILPFRTIGHFITKREKKQLLLQIYNNLEKGGIFIFDHYILDKKWAMEHNNKYIKMYQNDKFTIFDRYSFNFNKKILECRVFKDDKQITSFIFSWFEPLEIKKLIKEIGFKIKYIYGNFDFSTFNKKSEEQIWILEK